MDPLYKNVLAAVGTFVYVKVVIFFCEALVHQKILSSKISRKIIHVAAGSWIIFWPLFDKDHWTWCLNVSVPVLYAVQLSVKGFFLRDPNDPDVITMSRSGNPTELCEGPLFFTIIMTLCGLFLFMEKDGVYIMACLGFGDGFAPLFGGYFPLWPYPTFPFGPKDYKTVSGSFGFFVSSFVGMTVLHHLVLHDSSNSHGHDLKERLLVAVIATFVEGVSGWIDNICISGLVYLTLQKL